MIESKVVLVTLARRSFHSVARNSLQGSNGVIWDQLHAQVKTCSLTSTTRRAVAELECVEGGRLGGVTRQTPCFPSPREGMHSQAV